MDNEKKAIKRNADSSDLEYYVTPPRSSNLSYTESDHDIVRTENSDVGNGVVASPKSTATSDGELEDCNNEIDLIDLTNDSEDEDKKVLRMIPRQMPLLLPLPRPLPAIFESSRPKTDADIQPALTVATASKPQPSAEVVPRHSFVPEVETAKYPTGAAATATTNKTTSITAPSVDSVNAHNSTGYPYYPWSESCHFSTNTGPDFSQHQNPDGNYFGQWPWEENMEYNSGSDIIPPPPELSPPFFDFSYYPRSRYAVPGKPSTLITINTNADATNTARTRTPLSSVDFDSVSASVSVPVPTPNPQTVSASANDQRGIEEENEGGYNGTMLAGVDVEDQPDRYQNQLDSTCTAAVVETTSSTSSSSGHSIGITGPETLVNTSTSDLVPSSTASIIAADAKKPCTNVTKKPVKRVPSRRRLNGRIRTFKLGFDRLYDSSTDATGNLIEYSCIVGPCKFETKVYSDFKNHVAEKHLKSSELTKKLALFTSVTFNPLSTQGQEKTKFVCNFLGCEKETMTPSDRSRHPSKCHLDMRNYCPFPKCHEKFLFKEQLALHRATFVHMTEDNNQGE